MRTLQSARLSLIWMAAGVGCFLCSAAASQSPGKTRSSEFLGLNPALGKSNGLWEGPSDYTRSLKPAGKIKAVMLFARFSDATIGETTESLYDRFATGGSAYFERASYGKMSLEITPLLKWISMDHPSTWPNYSCSKYESHKNYISEVIRKAAPSIDLSQCDIVYVVATRSPGFPNSPTWGSVPGQGIQVQGREILHAVTFGNDTRLDRWGWQTLAHETGHVFGLPDLYSFDYSQPYKGIHKYVGGWDIMGYQPAGSEYLAWQKRKLEWLSDGDFVVAKGDAEVLVNPVYEKAGVRGLVVPINETDAYVVEVRGRDFAAQSDNGVLLYRVSLKAEPGQGPIRIIAAAPDDDSTSGRGFITLFNALYLRGIVMDDSASHIRIEISGRSGKAFRIGVTR